MVTEESSGEMEEEAETKAPEQGEVGEQPQENDEDGDNAALVEQPVDGDEIGDNVDMVEQPIEKTEGMNTCMSTNMLLLSYSFRIFFF